MAWRSSAERWGGLARSLFIYWRPGRQRGLRRLYRPFVGPDDLVFDVGAHLGDRTAAFLALGARVVALEPQPAVRRWLERLVGGNPRVIVRAEAIGRAAGTARLALSRRTPTVSTLADRWTGALPGGSPVFEGVRWEETIEVPVITLDELIDRYGAPRFCKIDVEGYEAEALAGLTRPVPALSVEFVSGAADVALACVWRLDRLASYEFNAILREERSFVSDDWWTPDRIAAWLSDGADGAPSGDVYARLRDRTRFRRGPR